MSQTNSSSLFSQEWDYLNKFNRKSTTERPQICPARSDYIFLKDKRVHASFKTTWTFLAQMDDGFH